MDVKSLREQAPKVVSLEDRPYSIADFLKSISLIEIFKGLTLTFSTMFKKPVTLRYPLVKKPDKPGFRGLHALVRDPRTNDAKCVGCGLCAAICPSQCITIYTSENEKFEKVVDGYNVEIPRCVFCAFCVEACPYGAIVLTGHYEYSAYSRADLMMTKDKLLDNWDKYMAGERAGEYFKRFWKPKIVDYKGSEDQAVFKGR